MTEIKESFLDLARAAYDQYKERVRLFINEMKQKGLYTPIADEERFVASNLLFPEPGRKVLKFVCEEFATLEPEDFFDFDTETVNKIVVECAVERFIFVTFKINVHAY